MPRGRAPVLPFYPAHLPLGDKLQRLASRAPEAVRALEVLVGHVYRQTWPYPIDPLRQGRPKRRTGPT